MSRRELLTGLGAIAATCGATMQTVEPEPLPLLLVLKVDGYLSAEAKVNVKRSWEHVTANAPNLPPLVILDKGATLEAILDPRHAHADGA